MEQTISFLAQYGVLGIMLGYFIWDRHYSGKIRAEERKNAQARHEADIKEMQERYKELNFNIQQQQKEMFDQVLSVVADNTRAMQRLADRIDMLERRG